MTKRRRLFLALRIRSAAAELACSPQATENLVRSAAPYFQQHAIPVTQRNANIYAAANYQDAERMAVLSAMLIL